VTYSVKDLQERYGVGEHTILAYLRAGVLKAIDVSRPGSRRPKWRITQAALDAFEALRTPTPPLPRTRRTRRTDSGVIEFYK
jgi:hypothetical protein